jgi:nucleoside-diphosphate-sugar epimerase
MERQEGAGHGRRGRIRVLDAVSETLRYAGRTAKIKFLPDMPVGPLNRVADYSLAKSLLGWEPRVSFVDGLHRTIDWYFSIKDKEDVRRILGQKLTER